jgi:hypothetical protein
MAAAGALPPTAAAAPDAAAAAFRRLYPDEVSVNACVCIE